MDTTADGAAPVLDLSDVVRPPEKKQQSQEEWEKEFASQQTALVLGSVFEAEEWLTTKIVPVPSRPTCSYTLNYLLDAKKVPQEPLLQGEWNDLAQLYKQLSMGHTRILISFTATQMQTTVWGCEQFDEASGITRVMRTPPVDFKALAPIVTKDGLRAALQALCYVKLLRRAPNGSANKCFVGKTPLVDLYFAATLQIVSILSYHVLHVLKQAGKLQANCPIILLVSPSDVDAEPHKKRKHVVVRKRG